MEFDWFWFTIVIGIICVSCFPHRAYKNQYNLNVVIMEVKNGIIIDGVLHEAVHDKIGCKRCSLLSVCHEFNVVCAVIGCEGFVNRGKVTVTLSREVSKNVGEIIKNR